MAGCKGCIHYEACNKFSSQLGLPTTDQLRVYEYCGCFKNAADVVEVVRCRDCVHFTEGMAIGMCKRIEDKPILPIPANHFCSFGKRRSEDEKR